MFVKNFFTLSAAKRAVVTASLVACGLSAAQVAVASPELMKSKNCSACHAIDKKSIGPAFKDVAAKYSKDAKAVETLVGKVRNGGVGVWGNIMMPANPQVTQAEAETLVRWILTQK
jgi:cytochrome c